MKAIKLGIGTERIVKTFTDGAAIIALTGVGVIGWKLASVHKRIKKIEVLDTKIANELEEYFNYADEQKKRIEEIKKEIEP